MNCPTLITMGNRKLPRMNPLDALTHQPPAEWSRVVVVDSHTGGEPFRVVISGVPEIPGNTVLERRAHAMTHLDGLRRLLMWEPRGHADMYGAIIGPPERSDSDLAILFMHNEGFSTMCGHGIIAVCKVLHDTGIIEPQGEEHVLAIDTPAGQIVATSTVASGEVVSTRFVNVPSFVLALDHVVNTSQGSVTCDIAYGGAFYAYVDAESIGVNLSEPDPLIAAGREIKTAVMNSIDIVHPEFEDLGFLYGVIFTGPPTSSVYHSRNVCVFADGEIDRSPTGTGVSGRLALLDARYEIGANTPIEVESIVGSRFTGRIVGSTEVGHHRAIVPEVTGSAHLIGRTEFWVDPSDEIGKGFFLR